LAEAGYPDGFRTVLTNRNVKLPYIDLAVYLISSWKKIGVEAEHKLEESATWSQSRVTRDFELLRGRRRRSRRPRGTRSGA
jgi:ABC-type transport system substrate-binding protein